MAKHREVEERRSAMLRALEQEIKDGSLAVGQKLPPLRDLANRHGVSGKVAWTVVQQLVASGALHALPRRGVFVGKPDGEPPFFLLAFARQPVMEGYQGHLLLGFEKRVAELGGVSIALVEDEIEQLLADGHVPRPDGILRFGISRSREWAPAGVPVVQFSGSAQDDPRHDALRFADRDGGEQATRYLLALGHRNVAFLGVHSPREHPIRYYWSAAREEGWRRAMEEAGAWQEWLCLQDERPAHLVEQNRGTPDQFHRARHVSHAQLLPHPEITAVIAASMTAGEGLITALCEADIPREQWPAILCFDGIPTGTRCVISYMCLPWNEVGHAGAQMLWERHTGRLFGPSTMREVPMRLVPRLSCRPAFAAGLTLHNLDGKMPDFAATHY